MRGNAHKIYYSGFFMERFEFWTRMLLWKPAMLTTIPPMPRPICCFNKKIQSVLLSCASQMPILEPSGLFSVMFNTFLILFSAEVKKEADDIQSGWLSLNFKQWLPTLITRWLSLNFKRGSPSISKQCLKNLLP